MLTRDPNAMRPSAHGDPLTSALDRADRIAADPFTAAYVAETRRMIAANWAWLDSDTDPIGWEPSGLEYQGRPTFHS